MPPAYFAARYRDQWPGLLNCGAARFKRDGPRRSPSLLEPVPLDLLANERRDDIGESRTGAVETRLHGAEVHAGNLGDFFVRLAFEFAEHKHLAVMYRQTTH